MPDNAITESQIRQALAQFKDPESGRDCVAMDQVHHLKLDGDKLAVTLGLTSWAAPLWAELRDELAGQLREKFPRLEVSVEVEPHHRPPEPIGQMGLAAKSVIAVGSGKGGVGKSAVATLLAYGLRRAGASVGLLDADLYGPSIPHLLGSDEKPTMHGQRIQPVRVEGMPVMSIGFLVPPGDAVIWRGPMLHSAITQFLRDTDWGELDYLLIDLPPGTGDVALSLVQLLPLDGAVVVSTPQDVALLDVVKAIAMFRRVDIDVVGMVENMSTFVCPNCGARHEIFGAGGARRKAQELGGPFLGELALDSQIRLLGDQGRLGRAFEEDRFRPELEALCRNLVRNLAARRRGKPRLPPLNVL